MITAPDQGVTVNDMPVIERPGRSEITAVVESAVLPAQVEVTTFEEVGPDGVPVGSGTTFDCLLGAGCTAIPDERAGELRVSAALDDGIRVVVVHLYYLVENPEAPSAAEAIETNYASYVGRLS